MKRRILGIELRRSSGITAGVVVGLLGVAGLYTLALSDQTDLWSTQWTVLAVFERIMLILLWPVALGAGAWQARREQRSRMGELLGTTARPVWQRVLPASAAMAIGLVLGYGAILAAGAIRVAGGTSYFHFGWLVVAAVGALSLVAAGWLGMGIGRLWPSTYTAPALVVLGFVVLLVPVQLAKSGLPGPAALLAPLFSTTVDEFTRVADSVNLAQAVWFLVLAATGYLLSVAVRRRTLAVALVPAALGFVVAIPLLTAAPASGFEPDPAATAEVCTPDGRVCVAAAHKDALAVLEGPARQALKRLSQIPDAPTSLHEIAGDLDQWRTRVQPADVVWFHSDNLKPGGVWQGTPEELVVRMLAGAGTRPCSDDYRARAIAAAWLYGTLDTPGPQLQPEERVEREKLWTAVQALPKSTQVERIAALRTAARTCDGDLLTVLTGSAS
ncbi:hypothetical protein JOF56_008149 [Kibdelosporangium banguiense]|uniref:ABC-type transport system involved in multi-copper enzyme maturation, permease component n=1 Tax=Kibdelosporangium banguiense TaxID=1365924 RepID=A0ABS4TTP7_9PSEU|nr:hypothetical protein [Kibdelosporangium banguiense]MBP2327764.1 hypothetical protein [Kibdelosporangium banguiense]